MNDKQNYPPVSTLSNLSKVFENFIYTQINTYMSDKFPRYLIGCCKNHNTQHEFLWLKYDWKLKINLNKGNNIRAIFMDLPKAFDALGYFLLIVKLEAYNFDSLSLEIMKNYQTNRKHRCNVGNSYSIWKTITSGVQQGSILGSKLFNIFVNHIFVVAKNSPLCFYADNKTQFLCEMLFLKLFHPKIRNLQTDFRTL